MANDQVTIWGDRLKFGRRPTDGELLIGDGVGFNLSTISAGSNVTISNTAGGIQISSSNSGGTVTGVTAKSPLSSSGGTTPEISINGAIDVANGGTGLSTLTQHNILLGNGTGSIQLVAPGSLGNVLTSTGTTWASSPPAAAWTRVNKTATQTITSSTAFTDDTALSFAVAASKTYAFRVVYSIGYGAGGFQIGVNGPASPTRLRVATFSTPGTLAVSAYNTSIGGVNNATGNPGLITITGVLVNGANAGTLVMRIAQGTSNGAASNFEAGSFLEWAELF